MLFLKQIIACLCILLAAVSIASCKKRDAEEPQNTIRLVTKPAVSVTGTSAVLGGIVTDKPNATVGERGVCVATTSQSPSLSDMKFVSATAADTFEVAARNLLPDAVYYARAYAIDGNGAVSYGNSVSFKTGTSLSTGNTDTAVTLYISGGESPYLYALRAGDGSVKWKAVLGGGVLSSPMYADGQVYVTCNNGYVYAFDTAGTVKWKAPVKIGYYSTYSSPFTGNGLVYVYSGEGISAFRAADGTLAWNFAKGQQPCLRDNFIYTNSDSLYALDALTGAVKWRYPTHTEYTPYVYGDKIFVHTQVKVTAPTFAIDSVLTIRRSDGQRLSGVYNDIFQYTSSFSITRGNMYCVVPGNNGYIFKSLHTLDSATGVANHDAQSTPPITQYFSDGMFPLVTDSVIFVAADYTIYAFDAFTGGYLYHFRHTDGATLCGPTVVNSEMLYYTEYDDIANSGAQTYTASYVGASNIKTNTLKWFIEFRDNSFRVAAPCVVTRSGKVFRASTGTER